MFALVCWIWQHDMSRTYKRSKSSASVTLLSKQARCYLEHVSSSQSTVRQNNGLLRHALRCTKVYSCLTLILQVGMPSEQAQYIHRIGRTARAGKQGEAVLLLHDFEDFFLSELKGLPVQQMQPASQQASSPCHQLCAALVAVPTYIVQRPSCTAASSSQHLHTRTVMPQLIMRDYC